MTCLLWLFSFPRQSLTALSCFWPAFVMVRTQIGNPDGEEKPNKKYYDPRACIRSAEEATVKRMEQCFQDLRCVEVLGLGPPVSWQHTWGYFGLSLWDPLLKSKKGIENEHGRRLDFLKRLEDCRCSLICDSVFGPHLVLPRKRQRTSWGHAAVDFPPKQSLQPSHVPAILNQLYRQTRIWVSPHCLDPSGHQRMPSLAFLCHIVTSWEQN